MKLKKVKLKNFRCFGSEEQIIECNALTSFIGNNSTGKTTVLRALELLFSENASSRILQKNDFFIPYTTGAEDVSTKELYIETVFSFEELNGSFDKGQKFSVPPFFESLVVDSPNSEPYLRIRLEAWWENDGSAEGAIETNISFVCCPEEVEIQDIHKRKANRLDLNRVRMIYVPAVRDPSKQLRNISGTLMHQFMNSINWNAEVREALQSIIEQLNIKFLDEPGIRIIKEEIQKRWEDYNFDSRYSNALLLFNSTDIESAVKHSEVIFSSLSPSRKYSVDEMGDGLRSLFYISMVDSILEIENKIRENKLNDAFKKTLPVLTIVAIEEPENHIAPHLIGKLIGRLDRISNKNNSQVIISSHSPAIIKRISPQDIRYFRFNDKGSSTTVKSITLPPEETLPNQYKFVKEAITAYPELYFAKLVILGEGDSEEIILQKFFELEQGPIDESGITIVPLGGRHVNHFWRLLDNLQIPHITLLDLDREREGGGWGRIYYVLQQLIANGYPKEALLTTDKGVIGLSDKEFQGMKDWDYKATETMEGWINNLEKDGVYFSSPLDIDFLMLENYEKYYKDMLDGNQGPQIKVNEDKRSKTVKIVDIEQTGNKPDEYAQRVENDIHNSLKAEGTDGTTYNMKQKELMIWYNYFFLNRGKPSTHIQVLSKIADNNFITNQPAVIKRLIHHANLLLKDDR